MADTPSLDEVLSTANKVSGAAAKASDVAQTVARRVDVFNRRQPKAGRSTLSPGGPIRDLKTLKKPTQQDLQSLGKKVAPVAGMSATMMYVLGAVAVLGGYLALKKFGKI